MNVLMRKIVLNARTTRHFVLCTGKKGRSAERNLKKIIGNGAKRMLKDKINELNESIDKAVQTIQELQEIV